MRVLLFGRDGQVGRALTQELASEASVQSLGRREADFEEPRRVAILVRDERPDVVINAVAYTAVDKAETEPALARRINALAPAALGQAAAECGAWLIHYSTNYVFDGAKDAAYVEDDPTAPLSVYGASKRDGEIGVTKSGAKHLIFRLGWVHSPGANNFISKILRRAQILEEFAVVDDQIGTPTSASLVAQVTARILTEIGREGLVGSGIYHLAALGETSWHNYAQHIVEEAIKRGFSIRAKPEQIRPIATPELPGIAPRPRNSCLSTVKLRSKLNLDLPDWRSGVQQTLKALEGTRSDG